MGNGHSGSPGQAGEIKEIHPDGQRIAFWVTTGHGELWAMENFLPAGTGVKDTK